MDQLGVGDIFDELGLSSDNFKSNQKESISLVTYLKMVSVEQNFGFSDTFTNCCLDIMCYYIMVVGDCVVERV